MINNNILPYLKTNTSSTLLVLSATIGLVLLASPLVISNFLLQPVQAQTAMSFKTPTPASGIMSKDNVEATLTFDVHGTRLVNSEKLETNGAYKITSNRDGTILFSGPIAQVAGCCLTNYSSSGKPIRLIDNPTNNQILISTSCSTSATNRIDVTNLVSENDDGHFHGPVECSPEGGNTTTSQQSSSTTGTTTTAQDSDGDGIPDSSDRCASNSNQRCYKESK
jgi:hypothetical protein